MKESIKEKKFYGKKKFTHTDSCILQRLSAVSHLSNHVLEANGNITERKTDRAEVEGVSAVVANIKPLRQCSEEIRNLVAIKDVEVLLFVLRDNNSSHVQYSGFSKQPVMGWCFF